MKFGDSINGVIIIVLGGLLIAMSRSFPDVRGIEYGPGLFPTLVGAALVLAGTMLVLRKPSRRAAGKVEAREESADEPGVPRVANFGVVAMALQVAAVIFYIVAVDFLGFLIVMPAMLFCLLWWYDRRAPRAAMIAVVATVVLHTFFYQLMSVPLPWGLLEPAAGVLTW